MTRMVGSAFATLDLAHPFSEKPALPAFLLTQRGGTLIILPMASLAFDTLKAAKALRAAGFDDAQA